MMVVSPAWADARDYNGVIWGEEYSIPLGSAEDEVSEALEGFGASFAQLRNKFPFSLVDTMMQSLSMLLGQKENVDLAISVNLPGVNVPFIVNFNSMLPWLSLIRVMFGVAFVFFITRYFASAAWGLK